MNPHLKISPSFVVLLSSLVWINSSPVVLAAPQEPCRHPDNVALPFCDMSLPALERAKDILSRLTLEEKILQTVNVAAGIDKLHIPGYNWWTESLHGVAAACTDDGRCPTSYPSPIGMGATFNLGLVKTMASQISSEARRLFVENELQKNNTNWHWVGLDFWAPNINIFRDPRWGRGMETPGEDPYLSGQYAVMFVKGMQEGEDPRYIKAISTLKHYAAYSLENWQGNSRHSFDAQVSDQDLAQTYLPAFEAGIIDGRAGSVMCSYNAVNGIPACASSFLMQDILRDQWDWEGYVVSDCDAVADVFKPHIFKPTAAESAAVSLKAGTDLDCGSFYKNHFAEAVKNGFMDEGDLDKSLERLFTARIKLGLFDPFDQQPYMQYPPEILGHPDHAKTSLQLARESIVLLKNDASFLPLDSDTLKTVAAFGPHFMSTHAMCGNYYDGLPHVVSPLEGLKTRFTGQVTAIQGCEFDSNVTAGFDAAAKAASNADVAILFMGINPSLENEGHDRDEISLPGVQDKFIETIAKVQQKTVLVLLNGGPIDVSAAKENKNVIAILEAFYPGPMGGRAIADVLFGDYNPSGRLPYTIHKKEFVDQISMADMSMTNYPGRTYRFFRGDAVYPFGYGLSYTTFSYETIEVISDSNLEGGATYRVMVTNTGGVAGDTSVLAFLSFKESSNDYSCPQSQLFGIEKIHLSPGESKQVFFSGSLAALKCYRNHDKSFGIPSGWYSVIIGDHKYDFLSSELIAEA